MFKLSLTNTETRCVLLQSYNEGTKFLVLNLNMFHALFPYSHLLTLNISGEKVQKQWKLKNIHQIQPASTIFFIK